jgi:hypothetical protein
MPGIPGPPSSIRPDPNPHPDLPTLKKSAVGKLNDGGTLRYSTLNDYVDYLISQGHVRDLNDLIQNYSHLIAEIFFQWVTTGQLGCLFAVKLASKPRENRWLPIVQLRALAEGDKLGPLLNAHLDAAAENHEAAVIIFPDVITPQDVVALVNALCSDPEGRWYRTDDGIDPDPSGAIRLVGLRWVLKNNTCVNYVLGFSSLDTMPLTRQSPFTAIFLRIREEKRTDPHREDGRVQVHLADLDSTFNPQELHNKIWDLTKQYRANRVEPEKAFTARARVTFSVSQEAAKKLCPVKRVKIEKVK